MKKILALLLTLSIFAPNVQAAENTAHFISWGDEEGTVKRKGEDLKEQNEALPLMMKYMIEMDNKNHIDGILHTGDFVRFDPDETYYKKFLGNFLDRFYPTSGGDQEFFLAKYSRFIDAVPHLKMLYVQRASTDGNGLEYYYHTIIKDTHIISLYSPDDYRDEENTQFKKLNFYENADNEQFRWLNNLLFNIRENAQDTRPIIIISHGPVFNGSKLLVETFAKYKVNLVLNGDTHVFAHKKYKGVEYFVTGMMGDRYLGGCDFLDSEKKKDYIEKYETCFPKELINRKKGDKFHFIKDHYLDINISKDKLEVKAIELETGKELKF